MKTLAEQEISSAIYYPIPLHRQDVFAKEYCDCSLPVAEKTAELCFSLPIFPEMSEEQIEKVAGAVKKSFA
jgi:dTDP-4-amino-4,6-dideoxygalactose transaminase